MVDQFDEAAGYLLDALGGPRTPSMLLACRVWTRHESRGRITGNNPWNLHIGPSCPVTSRAGILGLNPSQRVASSVLGLLGNRYAGSGDQNVAIFGTLRAGVESCARNLKRPLGRFYGYHRVVAAARAGGAIAFLDALARSSWSAGRYGTRNGGANALIALYRKAAPKPAPVPHADPYGNPHPAGSMAYVAWMHSHGYSQAGGKWVKTALPVSNVPPSSIPASSIPASIVPIPLAPTIVEAVVRPYSGSVPMQMALGPYPAYRFGSAGPIFVLVRGGPAPVVSDINLFELAGRLAARGARAFCVNYRSDIWQNAVGDVEAAIADLRRLTSVPITLVSSSFGGIPSLVVALRDGKVDAYVSVGSSVRTSYPGFPDAVELAKLRPALPVSVIRGSGDVTGAEGREEFIAALHAAGHPGLNIVGPGDHTGTLYTDATLDAILETSDMIRS